VHYSYTNVSTWKFAYFLLFKSWLQLRAVCRWLNAKEELQNIVKGGETWKLVDLEDMYNVLGGGDPKWGKGIHTWLYEGNKNLGKLYED
jgi:hypothetical protein